jgi:Rrf2 family protein
MKINQATDYAFRAVFYLSLLPRGQVVEAKLIAEDENIPTRFLLKIFPQLIKAGIVESQRGNRGGYSLAKKPEEITLKDVLEAVEGPVMVNRCLLSPEGCNKNHTAICPIHQALLNIQQTMNTELEKYDFETLKNNYKQHLSKL